MKGKSILSDINNILNKLQRVVTKNEHKFLKDVYLGRKKAIEIKRKGLRKDSDKRKFLEFVFNRLYLENYGKINKEIEDKFLWG